MLVAAVGALALLQDRNRAGRPTHGQVEKGMGLVGIEPVRQQRKDNGTAFRFYVQLLIAGLLAAIPAALMQAILP